jgi:hypothetical protein
MCFSNMKCDVFNSQYVCEHPNDSIDQSRLDACIYRVPARRITSDERNGVTLTDARMLDSHTGRAYRADTVTCQNKRSDEM